MTLEYNTSWSSGGVVYAGDLNKLPAVDKRWYIWVGPHGFAVNYNTFVDSADSFEEAKTKAETLISADSDNLLGAVALASIPPYYGEVVQEAWRYAPKSGWVEMPSPNYRKKHDLSMKEDAQ